MDLRKDLDATIQSLCVPHQKRRGKRPRRPDNSINGKAKYYYQFKALVKGSNEAIAMAYPILMHQLNSTDHAYRRLAALHLIDYLFTRSAYFRTLFVDDLLVFMRYTMGLNGHSLPIPITLARELQADARRYLHEWYQKFGNSYRELDVAVHYLQRINTGDVVAGSLGRTDLNALDQRRRECVAQQILAKSADIDDNLKTVENALQLLVPRWSYDKPSGSSDVPALHGVRMPQKAIEISLDIASFTRERSDNRAIYDQLRECYRLMVKHESWLEKWIRVLTPRDAEHSVHVGINEFQRSQHDLMTRCNLWQQAIRRKKAQCVDIGASVEQTREEDDEEEEFIAVQFVSEL